MARLTQEDIRRIVVEEVSSAKNEAVRDFAQAVAEVYRQLLAEELRTTAAVHAEQLRMVEWIEEIARRGELDVTMLAEEAEQRAYALAVQKAENAVILAESTLYAAKEQVAAQQKFLLVSTMGVSQEAKQRRLDALLEQERVATERVDTERRRLASLKLESRGFKLVKTDASATE